nr:MAG TPA: hypothetical protein [Caudoviricetes sp.]
MCIALSKGLVLPAQALLVCSCVHMVGTYVL